MKLLIILLLSLNLFAYTLQDAKKLQYAELTPQNIAKYKEVLYTLQNDGNLYATYMLAQAYESGSYWAKDIKEAIKLYEKLASNNYKDTNLKLGIIFLDSGDFKSAKRYLKKAIKTDKKEALRQLLKTSIYEENKKDIKLYYKMCQEDGISLSDVVLNIVKQNNISTKTLSQKMEDKTFYTTKDYIVMVLKTIKSSKAMIKNLGFEINEYTISYSTDPTISVLVYRTDDKIDEKMAHYLAEDNILKKSILNALSFVNRLEPFLNDEVEQKLKWVRFEVGAHSNVKITMMDK